MLRTRSQTNQETEKKSRGTRKGVLEEKKGEEIVVSCDPLSFDFTGFQQQTKMEVESHPAIVTKISSSSLSSSARTRIYVPKQTRKQPCSEEPETLVERVTKKMRSTRRWISHDTITPPASTPTPGEVQSESLKSSQESVVTEVGVGEDGSGHKEATSSRPVNKGDCKKGLPRYHLDPNAFENAEKERILKSIYDKQRREEEMKAKLSKLREENTNLKQLLLKTTEEDKGQNGKVCHLPSATTILPTESIFKSSLPSSSPDPTCHPVCPPPQIKDPQETPLPSDQEGGPKKPLPKRRQQPTQAKRKKKDVEFEERVQKERELIQNLYNQVESDDDEEQESIWAEIQRSSHSSVPSTSKDLQLVTGVKTESPNDDDDDEIQIVKEVVRCKKLSEIYTDIIFEEAK